MLYPVLGWVFGWLWLFSLTWPNWCWGGVKISLSNLFNYFSVSGDSKQQKIFPQKKWYFDHNGGGGGVGHFVVGTTQKYHFFDAPMYVRCFFLDTLLSDHRLMMINSNWLLTRPKAYTSMLLSEVLFIILGCSFCPGVCGGSVSQEPVLALNWNHIGLEKINWLVVARVYEIINQAPVTDIRSLVSVANVS